MLYSVIDFISVNAGATLSKGFNRGLGTLTAGACALAVAELSKNLGNLEEVILIMSILLVGEQSFCEQLIFFFLSCLRGPMSISNMQFPLMIYIGSLFHNLNKAASKDEAI